jgi:hypothetical protein
MYLSLMDLFSIMMTFSFENAEILATAFRSTLEETLAADILLHVRDITMVP